MSNQAAIYARISKDREGAGLGVERQINDCKALCERNGWDIAHVITDNDISAYSGKPRPGYNQLLQLIADRHIDVVVVWHADRLHRRNSELERYIDVSGNDVATHTVKAGTLDLATPAGRAIARTLGAWASYEVETAQSRTKSAKEQAAVKGKYGGGRKWYGYALDVDGKWRGPNRIDDAEASMLHEARKRYVQGESMTSICRDLGITMRPENMRRLLLNPHYAGKLTYNGVEYPGDWPPIFTPAEHAELLAARESAARMKYWALNPSGARSYLVTGFLACAYCKQPMIGGGRQHKDTFVRRYRCQTKGCYRVFRLADPLETYITEQLLDALDTPQLGKLLQPASDENKVAEIVDAKQEHVNKLDRLIDAYQDGLLDKQQFSTRKAAITADIQATERALQREVAQLTKLHINVGERLSTWWETATLIQRRQLLGLCIARIECYSTAVSMKKKDYYKGLWPFAPGDIKLIWRDMDETTQDNAA